MYLVLLYPYNENTLDTGCLPLGIKDNIHWTVEYNYTYITYISLWLVAALTLYSVWVGQCCLFYAKENNFINFYLILIIKISRYRFWVFCFYCCCCCFFCFFLFLIFHNRRLSTQRVWGRVGWSVLMLELFWLDHSTYYLLSLCTQLYHARCMTLTLFYILHTKAVLFSTCSIIYN